MKQMLLRIVVLLLFVFIATSCSIGDIYAHYKVVQYEEYAKSAFEGLEPDIAQIVRSDVDNLDKTILNLGLIVDPLVAAAYLYSQVLGLSDQQIFTTEIVTDLVLYGISAVAYDGFYFWAYSDSPEEWFNKKIKPKIARLKYLKEKYSEWFEYIQEGIIATGMPDEVVREILGSPDEINRTVTSYRTLEQWVYEEYDYNLKMKWPHLYLYFEDGILKSWQEVN